MKVPWQRLIRFESTDGKVLYGEPILPSADFDLGTITEKAELKAKIIEGSDLFDISGKTKVTEQTATVKKLLGPLAQSDVPIVRCIGLNYAKHSSSPSQHLPKTFSESSSCLISLQSIILTFCSSSSRSWSHATALPVALLQAIYQCSRP